jgi:integrase/recombinase XerD
MALIERVRRDPPCIRSLGRKPVEVILAIIPTAQRRDRLLFRLIFEMGLRVSEALGVHLEDLDLTADDEHLNVLGKGGQRRTVLLDDARLVVQLWAYLKQTGYRHGPLFRAEKNGRGGRCDINRCRSAGRAIVPRPGSAARSTSCVIRTRPS